MRCTIIQMVGVDRMLMRTLALMLVTVVGFSALADKKDAYIKERCKEVNTVLTLSFLEKRTIDEEIVQLRNMICGQDNQPAQHVKYPSGGYAFIGPGYESTGSWKYPNGNFAFVGPNYSNKGTWRYPNTNLAFLDSSHEKHGSWKYPSGLFAYIGSDLDYVDAGTWYYPNKVHALVGHKYKDAESLKYPNANYAFVGSKTSYNDRGSWYYPNKKFAYLGPNGVKPNTWLYPNEKIYKQDKANQDKANRDGSDLVEVVEQYLDVKFKSPDFWRSFLPVHQTMYRLMWVEEQFKAQQEPK